MVEQVFEQLAAGSSPLEDLRGARISYDALVFETTLLPPAVQVALYDRYLPKLGHFPWMEANIAVRLFALGQVARLQEAERIVRSAPNTRRALAFANAFVGHLALPVVDGLLQTQLKALPQLSRMARGAIALDVLCSSDPADSRWWDAVRTSGFVAARRWLDATFSVTCFHLYLANIELVWCHRCGTRNSPRFFAGPRATCCRGCATELLKTRLTRCALCGSIIKEGGSIAVDPNCASVIEAVLRSGVG